jgi:hypothetical protein
MKWNSFPFYMYFLKKYFFFSFFIMLMKHFNSLFSSSCLSFCLWIISFYIKIYIFEEYNNIHIFFVYFRVVLWPKFRFALNLKTDGIRAFFKMRFKLNVVWDLFSNLFLFFACDEKIALSLECMWTWRITLLEWYSREIENVFKCWNEDLIEIVKYCWLLLYLIWKEIISRNNDLK